MLVNDVNLSVMYQAFKQVYTEAYLKPTTYRDKIAMTVTSGASQEVYGWVGLFPSMRQWLGSRVVNSLKASSFTITNLPFESTISISRNDIADDRFGIYKPVFAETGYLAAMHPEELIFSLLVNGFTGKCYDGQNFFDTVHPAKDKTGADVQVSNNQGGAGTPWFLLDTSREIKPLIWQIREPYTLESVVTGTDSRVFLNDEFLYGVRARANAGYGLWQLAYGSKQTLNATNYAAARAAMQAFRSDQGRLLGIMPTTLVVPPSLEDAGRTLLKTQVSNGGGSNQWYDSAELIVSPFAQ